MSFVPVEDEMAGKVIEGSFVWYRGSTSMFSWNCPAEIVEVNSEEGWFRVRSLDDLQEQDQRYRISVSEDSSSSRKTMWPFPAQGAFNFIDAQLEELRKKRAKLLDEVDRVGDKILKFEQYLRED